jgi:oxygen-independent coproporphyrinogen-3 oxidase
MAGIYIHIPFCKKACHYCNFHFSTTLHLKNELITSLVSEIELRKTYFSSEIIETIYFGGGTPSILDVSDLEKIIHAVHKNFKVADKIELTLEANPDDLQKEKINAFSKIGVNRLSIGIQSFFDEDLLFMNRTHNGSEAVSSIHNALESGIDNLSVDLIFGYPLLSDKKWAHNVDTVLEMNIPHLSCYAMTVEPHTAFSSFIQSKKMAPMDADQSAKQYEYLMNRLNENGYEHYEISNYAKPGKRAQHNSSYWKGISYLGIGPSAHSYNGSCRQWNIANNANYIQGIQSKNPLIELEVLTDEQIINESIMIGLRTIEGYNYSSIINQFTNEQKAAFEHTKNQYLSQELIKENNHIITLTQQGKLLADHIAADFFLV